MPSASSPRGPCRAASRSAWNGSAGGWRATPRVSRSSRWSCSRRWPRGSTCSTAWPARMHTLSQALPGDLPDSVAAALRVGFRPLSHDAQELLTAAAVVGDGASEALLGRATGLPAAALPAALDELEWQRWLEADSRGYSFVARLARQVVARDMLT